ncbi:MAG: DUF6786 family protein [Planctomycetota bacterium]
MEMWKLLFACLICLGFSGCMTANRNFGSDLAFLKTHTDALLLEEGDAKVIVVPAYQGRVMTSTLGGLEGESLGWVNYDLIASGEIKPHINVFGGEDRLWLGPEGGQFAIFFDQGDAFNLDDWQTPQLIDTAPFPAISADSTSATFSKEATLQNYSGTRFDLRLDRTVRLLNKGEVEKKLGQALAPGLKMVAYESENKLTNTGKAAWVPETGLLSIWILGMYKHSKDMVVVVPYIPGSEEKLGAIVNDAYFGKVPSDRLVIGEKALFFKGDGQYRSKIGVGPKRATPLVASYDPVQNVLTLVQYSKPDGKTDYVNSMWELQDKPYAGDVVNSYNDGPPEPGAKPLGPFYELETSSPAADLAPGASMIHVHRTIHLKGPKRDLNRIATAVLGVSLEEMKKAFN